VGTIETDIKTAAVKTMDAVLPNRVVTYADVILAVVISDRRDLPDLPDALIA
jgi:hypothetical protein